MRRDRAVLIARRIRTLRPSSCWIGLKPADPDRFSDTHLRTLQRRVQQWRAIMAKKLVYAAVDEPMPELPAMPELALVVGVTPGAKVSVTFLNEATRAPWIRDWEHRGTQQLCQRQSA